MRATSKPIQINELDENIESSREDYNRQPVLEFSTKKPKNQTKQKTNNKKNPKKKENLAVVNYYQPKTRFHLTNKNHIPIDSSQLKRRTGSIEITAITPTQERKMSPN